MGKILSRKRSKWKFLWRKSQFSKGFQTIILYKDRISWVWRSSTIYLILFWVEFLPYQISVQSYREKHLICRCQNIFSHVIFVNRSLHAFKIGLQIQNYKMYKTHITHVFQLYNYKILSNNSIQIDKGIRNVHFFSCSNICIGTYNENKMCHSKNVQYQYILK